MIEPRAGDFEQAKRLELAMVLVRWLGVVLGLYLISQTNTGDARYFPRASSSRLNLGLAFMLVLALANVVIWRATERARTVERVKRIGYVAFGLDAVVLLGLAWVYSYSPITTTWVVIYILPLEGALRYRLEGAVFAVVLTLLSEMGREAYLASQSPGYEFQFANVAFRVGIQALIALVAGFMARSLAREADNAADQAVRFQEAARRESLARRELGAFNTAILTGVAAEDLDSSIQQMATAIGRDLAFETFTVMIRDGDELVVKGMYGLPFYEERVPVGSGVTGTVASTGKPLVVEDVNRFAGYIVADASMRSEMAAPLRIGDEVIGVIDVESKDVGAFDEVALGLLTRLADQVALVIHSARLHARQAETLERLRELDQMKSDFVAIASHELRTPLTAIHGYVQTLVRRFDQLSSEEVQLFLATIDRQSNRMTRLVEDLLYVSKIEAGAIRVHAREVDLSACMDSTLESLGSRDRSRVKVEVDAAAHPVVMDSDKVAQILRNLIGNALKFSAETSPVVLRARVEDGEIELSVTDRGIGIGADELPTIFDRFHQASAVLTRETQGAGLGLYITKRLVEALGGTIDVRSARGGGSTFLIRLPQGQLVAAPSNGDEPALLPSPPQVLEPEPASFSAPNSATRAGS
jgi:signal transduction histidine kinase